MRCVIMKLFLRQVLLGTGKTYLAVAYAVSMLKSERVEKIILTRPNC